MRTVLSEHAVAMMGRCGCGVLIQVRALQGGVQDARNLISDILRCYPGRERRLQSYNDRLGRKYCSSFLFDAW